MQMQSDSYLADTNGHVHGTHRRTILERSTVPAPTNKPAGEQNAIGVGLVLRQQHTKNYAEGTMAVLHDQQPEHGVRTDGYLLLFYADGELYLTAIFETISGSETSSLGMFTWWMRSVEYGGQVVRILSQERFRLFVGAPGSC